MTYIGDPRWKYDIFLSYTRWDDQKASNSGSWVSTVKDKLRSDIRQAIGYNIKITSSEDVDADSLSEAIGQSAVLLPIISPSYLTDSNCKSEWRAFFQSDNAAKRVVGAQRLPLRDDMPLFPNMERVSRTFFYDDSTDRPDPYGIQTKEFKDQLARFRLKIIGKLDLLKQNHQGAQAAAKPGSSEQSQEFVPNAEPALFEADKFKVFLIYNERESDLAERGKRIKGNLENRELKPKTSNDEKTDREVHVLECLAGTKQQKAKLEQALSECDLVIQLIGESPGASPEWAPRGIVRFVAEKARATKIPDRQILTCRNPDLKIEELREIEGEFSKFVENCPGIIAQEQTVFEDTVLKHVELLIAASFSGAKGDQSDRNGLGMIVENRDTDFVRQLELCLTRKKEFRPIRYNFHDAGDSDSIRSILHKIYGRSRSVLVLRDMDGEKAWDFVDGHIDLYYKYFDGPGNQQYPGTVLCHAPPAAHDVPIARYKEIRVVDCLSVNPSDAASVKSACDKIVEEFKAAGVGS